MKCILMAALAIGACRSKDPHACTTEMADFRAWAKTMADTAPIACQWHLSKGTDVVALDADDVQLAGHLDRVERAPIVTVRRDRVFLDGQLEWQVPQEFEKLTTTLGRDLATLRDNYRMIHPQERFNGTFNLEIDQAASWELVADVLRVASRAGYPHVAILFERNLGIVEPPPSSDRKIEFLVSLALNERGAMNRSLLVKKVFDDCAPAREVIYSIAKVDDERHIPMLFEDVPKAVEACGCSVDLAAAKRVLWLLHPRFGCSALRVTLDGKAPTFAAAADATWANTYRKMISAVRSDAQARINPASW